MCILVFAIAEVYDYLISGNIHFGQVFAQNGFRFIVELKIANGIAHFISNVFKLDHISFLSNSSLHLFPTI